MRRGNLLLIGVTSAVVTVISLNLAFGRSWNYNDRYYGYHGRYCHERYHGDDRQKDKQRDSPTADSSNGKY